MQEFAFNQRASTVETQNLFETKTKSVYSEGSRSTVKHTVNVCVLDDKYKLVRMAKILRTIEDR